MLSTYIILKVFMNFLSRIWGWLTATSPRKAGKAHPDLNPYDVQKLVEELDLKVEARRLGSAGVPAPDAQRPGGAEAEAIQRVDRVRQDYVDWASIRLNVHNERLEKADVTSIVNRAKQSDREFERKASSLITERETALRITSEQARQVDAELREFKSENQLSREAVYPYKSGSFVGYAILVFLIVLEGVINARFFAEGVDTGWLGGAAYAMSLAALNVMVAYSLGRWPSRYLHHNQSRLKLIGWSSVLAAFVCMFVSGLSIAHFRDSLIAGTTDASVDAMNSLLTAPLMLNDLMSWGLFAISIGFAIIAFFDGQYSDDLYPGYGKLARRAVAAKEEYEFELQDLRSELDELREQAVNALEAASRDAQAAVSAMAAVIDDKRSTKLRLEAALQDSANSLEAVLLIFRQENEVARKGLQRPAYFEKPPQLVPLNLPNFDTKEDEQRLRSQRLLADSLMTEVHEIRARIQAAFNQKFDFLKPLPHHFQAKEEVS